MLLRLTHVTDLIYSDLVSESIMELRMAPRQEMDQHRLSFELSIGPETQVSSYFDWLGNIVHAFSISKFHSRIQIVASSVVETDRAVRDLGALPDKIGGGKGALAYDLYDFLQFGGPITKSDALTALVGELKAEAGLGVGELVRRMLVLIQERFEYSRGVTTAASPVTEVLAHRKGVCQDFAHLLIAMARSLGIPARYVSGMVHPFDRTRLRGATQTHAWVELYFPASGWVGVDPANNMVVGANFVKVAVGRDFRDVPPNKGLYRGQAKELIDVTVHSEEMKAIPPELVAERYARLEIPSQTDGAAAHREFVAQQQQIQQQQAKTGI
jgi:transglutaminase-like putative cysteine protease